ncbi:MAG TPA: protein-L-isoaspartate(D-aspartate) O-methyltransferase [Candidatus Poseidoniia archaeon]|nr:protein-L-isoaspartate(D-aspartate) O-methyltransferase [Candidatus Poseidoniia archaeon]
MDYSKQIDRMIEKIKSHSESNEINPRIFQVLRRIPRHKFVEHSPKSIEGLDIDYADIPRPIGFGQTISQPFIVAYMTDKLDVQPSHRVLEIGTGSGYQAAVLSQLCLKVFTVERIEPLLNKTLPILSVYKNIVGKVGNGYKGWKENAPYDRIMVTAMSENIPLELVSQLKENGKMIIPYNGVLNLLTKVRGTEYEKEELIGVRFVPLVNEVI